MADQDLLLFARESASRSDDLYALLSLDATATDQDVRRAFRKKALTAHPDKAGDNYDPALYERLERTRDVLLNPEAKEVYNNGMKAVLEKKRQREQMGAKRRQLVEELERREEEAKRQKTDGEGDGGRDKVRDMAARGRRKMEELRRKREEAEERERAVREREEAEQQQQKQEEKAEEKDYDGEIAELERRLAEKQRLKAEKKKAKRKEETKNEDQATSSSLPSDTIRKEKDMADRGDKVSAATTTTTTTNANSDAGPTGQPGNKFASTMARLRAAQAKKDEEKRRREEEEAKAAAAS
ncbi:uncharacterized protein QC764_710400 [Podospora pseudoanserina]|uniref:J domain-containing protein n=1 Tax=Podospora pseudoanserina TaxID=2609844 RepID=A0ABR0HLI6_9PEZI|nr:hypothetical protein QC764_710400 [Podospora pseudoanserina]